MTSGGRAVVDADVAGNCWVEVPAGSPFPLHNLPVGVARRPDGTVGAFVAIGAQALDVAEAVPFLEDTPAEYGLLDAGSVLNGFAGAGRAAHATLRRRLVELFTDRRYAAQLSPSLVPVDELTMLVPVAVGDYVDFYSSIHHATNLGRLFRPDGEALLPNWRHLPVGYHGRSGTLVADGADVCRPCGLRLVDGVPAFGTSERLDIELEVGFVVGAGSRPGQPIPAAAQQLAHMTVNGASVRPGDLFASGTVSGPDRGSEGSLIELAWNGEHPIELPDGTSRSFLEDGDRVTLHGWAGSQPATRIGLGSVTGTIVPGPVITRGEH